MASCNLFTQAIVGMGRGKIQTKNRKRGFSSKSKQTQKLRTHPSDQPASRISNCNNKKQETVAIPLAELEIKPAVFASQPPRAKGGKAGTGASSGIRQHLQIFIEL